MPFYNSLQRETLIRRRSGSDAASKFRSNLGQWRRGETVTCFVVGTPVLVPIDQLERYR